MLHRHIVYLKEQVLERWGHRIFAAFGVLALVLIGFVSLHSFLFGPAGEDQTRAEFIVEPDETLDEVAAELETEGYVRHATIFKIAYSLVRGETTVRPGDYVVAHDMDAWSVAKTLGQAPYLSWVTIPAGLRKEEIADILTEDLGWTRDERAEWLAATELAPELYEGVYFPDTYLIPSDQPPADVAARLRGRFEEAFAPYAALAEEQGVEWTTVVNLAAIIEKEAAKNDKKLVAGIPWNRLDKGMMLQVDATLQYLAGSEEDWWPTPDPADKATDSPFNTYKNVGLPKHPIANPSLASIEAVLDPDATKCLYYLHDNYGRIHCSTNYKGHVANVNRYLK